MSSFEETLFKAMLPMFERALHSAANQPRSDAAMTATAAMPTMVPPAVAPVLPATLVEIPKAA